MRELSPASREPFETLAGRGHTAVRQGDFRGALRAYEAALVVARESGDRGQMDRAELNRAMVLIQMDEAPRGEEGLREILLRTAEPQIAWSAAYNLASSLRRQGRYERAARFAVRAMDVAGGFEDPGRRASTYNLLGNIRLSQGFLDDALVEYRRALELHDLESSDHRYSRAILLENIGYCLVLKSDFDEADTTLRQALELAEQIGDRRCRAECLQDLCYAYLLQQRYGEATAPGAEALTAALADGYTDIEENCHYLLGEVGTRIDDPTLRDHHFDRLQEMHPELPFLRDFLCTVDVTSIITLKR